MSATQIVEIAQAMISGTVGIVEGSRQLYSLRDTVSSKDHDPDFILFAAIDSESDHIPLGKVRDHWSENGLAQADRELYELESKIRPKAIEACKKLVKRFANHT